MLIQLTTKDWIIRIQRYKKEAVSAISIEWTFFYQDPLPRPEYIALNTFYSAGIVVSKARQF